MTRFQAFSLSFFLATATANSFTSAQVEPENSGSQAATDQKPGTSSTAPLDPTKASVRAANSKMAAPDAEAVKKAEQAKARHLKATAEGKKVIAARLSALLEGWLRVGATQRKAAVLETDAAALERQTLDYTAQAKKASALLEQTEARRARALTRLKELGLEDKDTTEVQP